ncbi:MAG: hypothetical protein KJ646_01430 [Nanoarchaeota archaeon]|nr:hypothetical protein [Nanoarchaeota archaeon]MBU4116235.1 hypothetical protein [Nanoarchaeota archaeon]MBU4311085.1 hypothetical protein [bacterium]
MPRYTKNTYTLEQYNQDCKLINAIKSQNDLDFRNPERDIGYKRNILRTVLNYNGLRIGSNKSEITFLPLDKCNSGRITLVLQKSYESALNRVRKFGNPDKRDNNEKGLVKKIRPMKQLPLFR